MKFIFVPQESYKRTKFNSQLMLIPNSFMLLIEFTKPANVNNCSEALASVYRRPASPHLPYTDEFIDILITSSHLESKSILAE